jgi:hypothetical protein
MKKTIFALAATAFLALGLFVASGQAPPQYRGVLSGLHVGQQVSLKETSGRFEVGVFENGPGLIGHKVVEANSEFLVVQQAGIIETRIPIFSIKSIVTIKVEGRAK